jgi:hypothetical protein
LYFECLYLGGLLHELSNDCAKKQFETFLENDIFPVLVESAQVIKIFVSIFLIETVFSLQRGDRECQIVILCDDDLIEWDDDYPPQLGQEEDKAQSMKLSKKKAMLSFFCYRGLMRKKNFLFSHTFDVDVSIF